MTLREELYLRETIKRFNDQGLTCEDSDKARKVAIKFVNDMMSMLGIRSYRYRIKFEHMANEDGSLYDEISLVGTI